MPLHDATSGSAQMPKVRRLPAELANQIAAGEVVERPASVVKELVENALDAGARRIQVHVELGGKRRIRVEDDGEGMDAADAALAFERHATSKIGTAADLEAIRTLGFRGEALPSIASVSRLTLRTRVRGETAGTEVRVTGGHLEPPLAIGAPEGTAVEVADLFFNLPARRKFLKSDVAETAQVSRVVTQLALVNPGVGFALTSGSRQVLQCPPVASVEDRFFQIQGDRPDLVAVRREAAGLVITGYAAALTEHGPVRGQQNVFVNGRIVKDRTIAHAIAQAYSTATIKERSPEVHLLIEMPPDRVDVNVHPAKAEVRFLEQSLVHEVLRRALMDALGATAAPAIELQSPVDHPSLPGAGRLPGLVAGLGGGRWAPVTGAFARTAEGASAPDSGADAGPTDQEAPGPDRAAVTGSDGDPLRRMTPLGQFRNTFILAVDDGGISIIDQHVAHERVLFERITTELSSGRLDSQRLLVPVLLDLGAGGREALRSRSAELDRLGFEVEPFGGDSVRITAVPAILPLEDAAASVRALAGDLEGLDRSARVEDAMRRMAATMACHAAVKAHDPLTMEKMRYILDELERTAYSSVCPHGRPVVLRLTRREVERNFQRI